MIHRQALKELDRIVRDGTSSSVFHLFFAGLVTVIVFLYSPSIFSGDTDTARNYLNTIVSSLSTILALCISIILVAIQMTAGNYTHRVLDFYVRLPYNVSLFFFYLAAIMHSLFLMARIRDPLNDPLPSNLSREMSADLVLVVICFFSLLLYMYAVVQLLKPDRIIELIVREYNRAFEHGRLRAALDSVEQICDIAKRASSFSDSVTGTHCLDVMSQIAARLPLPKREDDPLLSIHGNMVDQWVEIFGVAVKERDTAVLTGVLNALSQQGVVYVEANSWRGAELVIRAYRKMTATHLLTDGHVAYIEAVVERLYQLSALSASKGPRGQTFALRTWHIARAIGEASVTSNGSAVGSLARVFLMTETFHRTLNSMADKAEWMEALVCYFQLWKVFVPRASRADMAQWGDWWMNGAEPETREFGMQLAFALTSHLRLPEVRDTLTYVWSVVPQDLTRSLRDRLTRYRLALFDGWPIPSVPSALPSQ